MSATFHWDIKQNTEDWFRLRMSIPTASAMDKIITPTGKKSSQAEAYMAKLLWEYVSGVPLQEQEDMYQSPWMEHGHEYEATTVKAFEFQTGLACEKVGFISNWDNTIGASPDRIVRGVACCEIKSPAPYTQLLYLLDKDSLAKNYWPQLQAQIFVSELDKQFMCSDHHRVKAEPVILEIPRDDKYCATMALYLREFVDALLEKRLRLDREFGLRPPIAVPKPDGLAEFGVSQADVDAIIAAGLK